METQRLEIQPRNHFVILKSTTKISPLLLTGVTPSNADMQEKVIFEVAAIGDKVVNLEIGEIVFINNNPEMILDIPSNKNSKKAISELYKDTVKDNKAWQEVIKQGKITIVEYIVIAEFNIIAKAIKI